MPTVQGKHASKSNAEYQAKYANMPGTSKGKVKLQSYADISPDLLAGCVSAIAAIGGATMFTITGDGGAYAVTVFVAQERRKMYPTSPEELEELLTELSAWATAVREAA